MIFELVHGTKLSGEQERLYSVMSRSGPGCSKGGKRYPLDKLLSCGEHGLFF